MNCENITNSKGGTSMKKLGTLLLASFIAGAGLATPTDNVQASELPTYEVTSNYSIEKKVWMYFNESDYPDAPPKRYWYDDGKLRGWLYRADYIYISTEKRWYAEYKGTLYSGVAPMSSKVKE